MGGRQLRSDGQDAAGASEGDGQPQHGREALEENVQAIKRWEQAALHSRSSAEQLSDWIISTVAGGSILFLHFGWFAFWVLANLGIIPGITPFDPFPFPLLTMTVSLEAIFLSLFVLASQNRLSRQADKRAHLDLQIDLLAEREMTMRPASAPGYCPAPRRQGLGNSRPDSRLGEGHRYSQAYRQAG